MKTFLSRLSTYLKYKKEEFYRRKADPFIYSVKAKVKKMFSRPGETYDIAIIDDAAPNILSAFRAFEFSFFLKEFENIALFSMIVKKQKYNDDYAITTISDFEGFRREFVDKFNVAAEKILPFFPWTKINSKVCYIVFLNNAFNIIDYLEQRKLRFVLELYPGGGFQLLNYGAEFDKLKRVLGSPSLAAVIPTQKIIYKFLLQENVCSEEKIHFLYGGFPAMPIKPLQEKVAKYKINKSTIDVCFVANKYSARGEDKGYDIFIEMAHRVLQKNRSFRFHVVGGFVREDIPIAPEVNEYFYFNKHLKSSEFFEFYRDKDIFISPSKPFVLGPGSFDGFPTTTCVESGLNGLCMVVSDPLDMNVTYTDNFDIIILENDPQQFADKLLELAEHPEEIYRIGLNGKRNIDNYDISLQYKFRSDIVKKFIKNDQRNKAISSAH